MVQPSPSEVRDILAKNDIERFKALDTEYVIPRQRLLAQLLAENGSIEMLEYLASLPGEFQVTDTMFLEAFYGNKLDNFKFFLQFNPSFNVWEAQRDVSVYAAHHNFIEFLQLFHEMYPNCSINKPLDSQGNSPFMVALSRGHVSCAQYIRSVDPSLNLQKRNKIGLSAYGLALQSGSKDAFKYLTTIQPIFNIDEQSEGGFSLFLIAAQKGNLEALQYLAQMPGVVLDHVNQEGSNALILAAQAPNVECLQYLVSLNKFDINYRNHSPIAAIQVAVQHDMIENVIYLATLPGIDLTVITPDGDYLTHWAASRGSIQSLQYLLTTFPQFFQPDQHNTHGLNLLSIATNHANVIQYLLTTFPQIDFKTDSSFIHKVVSSGNADIIPLIYEYLQGNIDFNADVNGHTALSVAIQHHHLDVVKVIISLSQKQNKAREVINYVDPVDQNTPLLLAALMNDTPIIEYILSLNEVDVSLANDRGDTALTIFAAEPGNLPALKLLRSKLDDHFDINQSNTFGARPLSLAAMSSNTECLQYILSIPNVDFVTPFPKNFTPFIAAAYHERLDNLKLLYSAIPNLDINAQDVSGHSALLWAFSVGNLDCVKFLVSLPGINMTQTTTSGENIWTLSAMSGKVEVLEWIYNNVPDLDVNYQNNSSQCTALMWAAYQGHYDAVKYLVSLPNIDINAKSSTGDSAIALASERKHSQVVTLLSYLPNIDKTGVKAEDCTIM